jgi:carbon storage regulator
MLVLSRKVGDEIILNGNITLKVTDIGGGQVRLGFSAPRDVSIDRAEIHTAKGEFQARAEVPVTPHPAIKRIRQHLDAKAPRDKR